MNTNVNKYQMQQDKDSEKGKQALQEELEELRESVPKLEKLVTALEQTQKLQAALYNIVDVVSAADDMNKMYEEIHRIVNTLMYAENFFIVLYSEDRQSVYYPYFVDNVESMVPKEVSKDDFHTTVAGYVCLSTKVQLLNGRQVEKIIEHSCFKADAVTPVDWLGAPIMRGDVVLGAIVVQNYYEANRYTETDKELFIFVSQHIATVLIRKRTEQALKKAHDELEMRVKERTHELSIANERLVEEIKERKRAESLQSALYKISELANRPIELDQFYESVHFILKDLMYAENFFIAVFSEDERSVSFPYIIDLYDDVLVEDMPKTMPANIFLNTLTGYVVKTRKTFLATGKDLQSMRKSGEFTMVGSVCDDWMSWLGAPLEHGEQILGVIVVQSYEKTIEYTSADKELIAFVARHIATALFNKRAKTILRRARTSLEKRVEKRTYELSVINKRLENQISEKKRAEQLQNTLYRIAELSNRSIKPEEFYSSLHEIINELMYAENFYIAILNEEEKTLEFPYAVDQSGDEFNTISLNIDENGVIQDPGLSARVINSGASLLLTMEDFQSYDVTVLGNPAKAWLGVPLLLENKPWGMLAVQSYSEEISFDKHDERLLTFVSGHIATALHRKRASDLLNQAHKELRLINNDLESRVEQRTSELLEINQILKRTLEEQENTQKIQSALYQIAEVTATSEDMNELYESIHFIIAGLMYAKNFYIALYDEKKEHVTFPYLIDEYEKDWIPAVPIDKFSKTLTGYVANTAEPLLASKSEIERMQREGYFKVIGHIMVDWLGVPLMRSGDVLGVIAVQSYDESLRYNESHKEILTFVSQHIAAGLIRKRADQQLKKAHEDLERRVDKRTQELSLANLDLEEQIVERKKAEQLQGALYRIADLSNKPIQLEEFYKSLHKIINELIYAENFYIALRNDETDKLEFSYVSDKYDTSSNDDVYISSSMQKLSDYNERVARLNRPILISKDKAGSCELASSDVFYEMFSWLGVPLISDGTLIGVISVQSYSDKILFGNKDKELLTFVSQQISTALQHKRDTVLLESAHQELKEINDELEARVQERTHELSDANQLLQDMLEARKQIEQKLAHDACHDALTDLPNRTLFLDRLDNAIKRNLRNEDQGFAVLFLDLDRFKVVNDSLGHLEGDFLLREVGARLERCVRPGDTVARLGGDEFSILIDGANNKEMAIHVAERVLETLSQPFSIGDQTLFITTSIGITLSIIGYKDPEAVLRDADSAMYHAKSKGKAQYALFDIGMHEKAINRLKLENELRIAVQNNQVEIYYQPIIDIQTGKISAFEALARWDHAELGEISPTEFIPIAEETGLIVRLGFIVLEKAIQQVMMWREMDDSCKNIEISVNLSPKQIAQQGFFENIMAMFDENDVPHDAVKFEITESLLIHNFDQSKELLDKFYDENISVMLDDFGTGYSSLSYLHHFPLASLKVDRSFIMSLDARKENKEIVRTIKTLADSLDMSVIAEGIETEAQLNTLINFGFKYGQGFYFSKPLKVKDAELYLQAHIQENKRKQVAAK